jgi:hypothetical protein
LEWVEDPTLTRDHPCEALDNVSLGGLAFKSPRALPVGQQVSVKFPLLDPARPLNGKVVWNRSVEIGFEIGLEFSKPKELYRLRMIEQICHIEHYRKQVLELEGRELTSEQAATEWIQHFAEGFPAL